MLNIKKTTFVGTIFIFVTVCVVSACSSTSPIKPKHLSQGNYDYAIEHMRWLTPQLLDEHDSPGVSLALIDGQKLVWAEGFGYANVEKKIKATPNTIYRVGSISKTFTATAAMQLQEQGLLHIDAPLKNALPEFSIRNRYTDTQDITPRMIMSHHSGLPTDIMKGMWNADGKAKFTDVVTQFQEQYAAYPPNYIYSYSNAAISLLGHAIQRVSKQPFQQYIEENISLPMGMNHTSHKLHPRMQPLLAKGYSDGEAVNAGELRDTPAGGLYSSANDLSHFIKMILAKGKYNDRQILSANTVQAMMQPQNRGVALDFGLNLGLGWFLVDHGITGVKTVASHGGGVPCYFSQMIVLPEQQLGVVALSNSCTSGPVVANAATTLMKLAVETKTGIKQNFNEKVKKAPVDKNPADKKLKQFEGQFATWLGLISVKRNGRKLQAKLSGWDFDLIPHTDGKYSIEFNLFGLIPIHHLLGIDLDNVLLTLKKVDENSVVVMTFKGRDQILGSRVTPKPIPDIWLARLGNMEVTNPDEYLSFKDNKLEVIDGILVMSYKLKMPVLPEQSSAVPIMPISDDEAIVLGLGRGMNETIRIVRKGENEAIQYSGYISLLNTGG